jgi:YHS domain-containing protein
MRPVLAPALVAGRKEGCTEREAIGETMVKTQLVIAAALLVTGAGAARAGSAEYQNLDAMGLATGKGMKTKCEIHAEYEGKTYCFHDENAKAEFMKDAAGNRSKADDFYTSKTKDPNWTPCDYSAPPTDPNSCE